QRESGRHEQGTVPEPGPERVPGPLVQGVGGDPDGEEERHDRQQQGRPREMTSESCAEYRIAEVPERVRRVEEGPAVGQTTASARVEGRRLSHSPSARA